MIENFLKMDWTSATLIFLLLATAFSIQGSITILYILLLLAALYNFKALKAAFLSLQKEEIILLISFIGWLIATIISSIANNNWAGSAFENPIRLALASILYLHFKTINKKALKLSLYGFLVAPVMLISTHNVIPIFNRWYNYLDAVFYGDAAIISAAASILILKTEVGRPSIKMLSLISLAAALLVAFKSGTRGAWIAAPTVFLPFFLQSTNTKDLKKQILIAITIAVVAITALMQSHQFDNRINDIKSNLISWQKGNDNTSIGVRLAIWEIALEMYKENPIFGKGPGTFTQTALGAYQNGRISKMVVEQGAVQPHNEYLAAASQLGSIGLIADVAIFIIPMILFIDKIRKRHNINYASFGLSITLLFIIFGASIEILLRVTFSSIYGLLIALIYVIVADPPTQPHSNTISID